MAFGQAESRAIEPSRNQPSYPTAPAPLEGVEVPAELTERASPLPAPPDTRVLAPVRGIFVYAIEIDGNTAFSDDDLALYTVSYEDRVVAPEEIQKLRQDLTNLYRENGYVNSGVILPDQQVVDGVIKLRVIEGQLAETLIEGNTHVRDSYVRNRLMHDIDEPLNAEQLKANLRLLRQDPLIAQVNSELRPGVRPGEDILRVSIEEGDRYQLSVSFDNYRSPIVDEYRSSAYLSMRGPFGIGDIFNSRLALTDGSTDYTLSYVTPFTSAGATAEFYFTDTDSEVQEGDFKDLDIETRSKTYGILTTWPIHMSPRSSVVLLAGGEKKTSDNTVLGESFSLSAGENDGKAKGTSAIFGAEGWVRDERNVFAARLTTQIGLDALDATNNRGGRPDSEFTLFLGQAQYLRLLGWLDSQFIARTTFQYADDPLLPMHKLSVGGRYSVRGFREAYFVRDNGLAATVEWQVPLFIDSNSDWLNLRGVVFSDYGYSWDVSGDFGIDGRDNILSAGVGLLWNPLAWLKGEIYYGLDVKDVDRLGDDDALQDDGIQFQLMVTKSF